MFAVHVTGPSDAVDRFEILAWIVTGIFNLMIGAALCAAFAEGWDQRSLYPFHAQGVRLGGMWRPGCELPRPDYSMES